DFGRLLQEVGGGRRAHFEREGPVRVNGDLHRNRSVRLHVLGLGIECLAEFHDVDPALTKRGTDRRRWVGFTRRNLQIDVSLDLCRHMVSSWPQRKGEAPPGLAVNGLAGPPATMRHELTMPCRASTGPVGRIPLDRLPPRQLTFSTCPNSSSTGVGRPKIETATLSRERSSSTSSTEPEKEAKGPSATRTISPISKVTDGFGRSTPSLT